MASEGPHESEKYDLNPITAVKDCIVALSVQDTLTDLHLQYMEEFSDIFQSVPHMDSLPQDVECHIELIDPNKNMTNCTCSCPQKF